jgi:hypothetical protein
MSYTFFLKAARDGGIRRKMPKKKSKKRKMRMKKENAKMRFSPNKDRHF